MFADQLEAAERAVQDAERCVQAEYADPLRRGSSWARSPPFARTLCVSPATLRAVVALAQQALELLPEADAIARAPALVSAARRLSGEWRCDARQLNGWQRRRLRRRVPRATCLRSCAAVTTWPGCSVCKAGSARRPQPMATAMQVAPGPGAAAW